MSGELISKQLAQQPIILPGNPVLEVLTDFGRDELIALIISTLGVGAASFLTDDKLFLSIVGPIIEKLGFFAYSSKEALDVYQTTPIDERNPKQSYLVDALRNGMPNLVKDVTVHDPLYAGLMLLGLQQFPETPVWMLSVIAFMISIGIIAGTEVITKEVLYQLRKERLKRLGFSLEKHLEARFIVKNIPARKLLEELADYFELGEIHTSTYHDTYFPHQMKSFNGRQPIIRLRRRHQQDTKNPTEEVQVVYTCSTQVNKRKPDQHNFFPVRKDKFKLPYRQGGKEFLQKRVDQDAGHNVYFTRDYAYIPGKMFISTDQVYNRRNSYTVVEVKSIRNQKDGVQTMIMAMRHIMSKYDVAQTTLSKRKLTGLEQN